MSVAAPVAAGAAMRVAGAFARLLAGAVVGLLLVITLLSGASGQEQACDAAASGPGSLGGLHGTGLTTAQVAQVRDRSPYRGSRLTTGVYHTTAYGPPWGGIQGAGTGTSGGLEIGGGNPRWYMVAVDPSLIQHGNLVYLWPNPFNWRGPFLAADTGGAIGGRRIDFYDWRGRATQLAWGQRDVQASDRPLAGEEPAAARASALGGDCAPIATATDVGGRIGQIARSKLGSGPSIPDFEPPVFRAAWCAWFATNVWRQAGVPMPLSAWSGYFYDWAAARDQLFKAIGRPPRGPTPPVGSALMYGTESKHDSRHVNLVDAVNPDGSFMVTGGNQGNRVTRYGPCRLRQTDPAGIVGPGCDTRPIYGIAMPTAGAA